MTLAKQADVPEPRPRRRTVRIVQPRSTSRTGKLSLLMAIAAALAVIVVYRLWQSEVVVRPNQRTIYEMVLDWKCERGHAFQVQGQVEPTVCPSCGRPAHPVASYFCPEHGIFEAAVRFSVGEDGSYVLSEISLQGRDWMAPVAALKCPKCNRELLRQPKDPLAGVNILRR